MGHIFYEDFLGRIFVNDSLKSLNDELSKHAHFDTLIYLKQDKVSKIQLMKMYYHFARAKYIILDDYYRQLYGYKFNKETEIIGRWAYKDVEKSKIARKIPKIDKKAEKLNAPDPKTLNGHSEFVKRLEQMAKINEDPDKDKDPRDIEKENTIKAKKQIEQSDDYLDRF